MQPRLDVINLVGLEVVGLEAYRRKVQKKYLVKHWREERDAFGRIERLVYGRAKCIRLRNDRVEAEYELREIRRDGLPRRCIVNILTNAAQNGNERDPNTR